jgi:hypothetical protein
MSGDFLPKQSERHSEECSVCVLRCDSLSEGCWGAESGSKFCFFTSSASAKGFSGRQR